MRSSDNKTPRPGARPLLALMLASLFLPLSACGRSKAAAPPATAPAPAPKRKVDAKLIGAWWNANDRSQYSIREDGLVRHMENDGLGTAEHNAAIVEPAKLQFDDLTPVRKHIMILTLSTGQVVLMQREFGTMAEEWERPAVLKRLSDKFETTWLGGVPRPGLDK